MGYTFQQRVAPWMEKCFGTEISKNVVERNHRFLEESLELVQSLGCTQSEAHQLVDYVFGRPVGDTPQEVGGVMVTLAALSLAVGLSMHEEGEIELARVWKKIDVIRAKQAAKPKHGPLPEDRQPDGLPVEISYRNWRDEAAKRQIIPIRVWFGMTQWHPEPQWFLEAWDVNKATKRDFAIADIGKWPDRKAETSAGVLGEIGAERRRQIEVEGYDAAHDDAHSAGEIARGAAVYAAGGGVFKVNALQVPQQVWPYQWEYNPKDPRTNYVRAAAMLVAEIERMDRATAKSVQS